MTIPPVLSQPVIIRPAIPADQPDIEAILAASPQAANWADTYPMLVADQGNQVTAFLLYRPIADECEILNLAVNPNHRRQGLAKHLLRRLIFSDPYVTQWHLEVRASNTAAIELYQYFHFSVQGQRPNYYSDGETALLLSLKLERNMPSILWLAGLGSSKSLPEYFRYSSAPPPIIDPRIYALDESDEIRQSVLAESLHELSLHLVAQAEVPAAPRVLNLGCDASLVATAQSFSPLMPQLRSNQAWANNPEWPFPDASFDLIFCCHLLHHLPSPIAAARKMRSLLAPKGKIIAIEPDFTNDPLLTSIWCKLFPEPRQGAKLKELFQTAGTQILASGTALSPPSTPSLRQLILQAAKRTILKHNLLTEQELSTLLDAPIHQQPITSSWIIATL